MKKLFAIILAFFPIVMFAQISITPYISTGYINHLTRNGINTELGLDVALYKRLDISVNYRFTKANKDVGNEVTISGFSSNISYVLINRNNHRFMFGPGFTYGKYTRYSELFGFEKEYNELWFDFVKFRYDYTFSNKLQVGAIASLDGDDGDSSTYLGVLLGYKF